MIGKTLSHYKILEQIGAGGMGVVYRAHDDRLGRDVALKLLPADTLGSASARRALSNEASTASALNHPNICTIHDVGEAEGQFFVAMEFVEGKPLAQLIPPSGLPQEQVVRYGMQIADALAHAEQRGVVHRDLKSANVVVTPEGRAKVLDFGLALRVQKEELQEVTMSKASLPASGGIAGTLAYMAPEALRGGVADARTDLWALGVVLYEMAAGELPFQGATGYELSSAILREPPRALPARVPAGLRAVIQRCLVKDPAQRYQRAGEVRAALEAAASSTVAAPFEPPAMQPRSAFSRSAMLATAGVLGLLVLTLAVAGYFVLPKLRGTAIDSVAVLPFVNGSGDANLEYLSDGITEELINHLTQVNGLKVIARPTVFTYKGREVRPEIVGSELKVRAVVTGRVVKQNNQVTVQVDLIDSSEGSQLWGGQFQRAASEVQAIQADIVRQVTSTLRLKLSGEQQERLAKNRTTSPEAFELYLRGRKALTEYTAPKLRESIEYFQQAVEQDPGFAKGWAGLADAYAYLTMMGLEPPRVAMPKARETALKALQIDDAVGEAHTSLGIVKVCYEWDFPGAEKEFRRAMDLSPGDVFGRHWHAHFLEITGHLDEAIAELKRIVELDPFSPMYSGDLAADYFYQHQPERVVELAQKYAGSNQEDPFLMPYLALAYERMGRRAESLATLEKAVAIADNDLEIALAGSLYPRLGKRDAALKILANQKEKAKKSYVSPFSLAVVYFALGNKDLGFQYLEKSFDEHSSDLPFLVVYDPMFDPVRGDPRFQNLIRRMNLPEKAYRIASGGAVR